MAAPLVAAVPHEAGVGQPTRSLAEAARRRGRLYGAAVRIDQIEADPALRAAILRDCSALTAEIHFKWDAVEPAEGRWTPAAADRLAAFAHTNRLALRGHTLLWDQSTPDWVKAKLADGAGWALIESYFGTMLPRYADQVAEWDVVNEPIDTVAGDSGFRRNCFQQAFGTSYLERALESARTKAPTARLMINDYGFDYDNVVEEARRTAFLKLAERLKARGAPLDGVGVQAHLDLAKGPFKPKILRDFLAALGDLGLSITITELDVREDDLHAPLSLRDARVAAETAAYLDAALDVPAVTGVYTWGLSDRHSWLQDSLPPDRPGGSVGLNRGLPYDAELARKPMYFALERSLSA